MQYQKYKNCGRGKKKKRSHLNLKKHLNHWVFIESICFETFFFFLSAIKKRASNKAQIQKILYKYNFIVCRLLLFISMKRFKADMVFFPPHLMTLLWNYLHNSKREFSIKRPEKVYCKRTWLTCSSGFWSCGKETETWWEGFWLHCHWLDSWCTRCSSNTGPALQPVTKHSNHKNAALWNSWTH